MPQGTLTFLNTAALSGSGKVSAAAGTTVGLGVGSAPAYFSAANVDSLFAGSLPNVSNDPNSAVGIDTTAGDFTYGSNIPWRQGLTKLGANILTLTGTNTYTGGTIVNAGILDTAVPASLPGYGTSGASHRRQRGHPRLADQQ